MSCTIFGHDHDGWGKYNLQDFSEFSDKISEVLMEERADYSIGQWFYIPETTVTDDEGCPNHVIYSGSWGNFNSPGASAYTQAELFGPDEQEDFLFRKQEWESYPEWIEEGCTYAETESEEDWVEED